MERKKPVTGPLRPDAQPLPDLRDLTDADFAPAGREEKEGFLTARKSVSYWADAWRRLRRNRVAMAALVVILLLFLFAFAGPLLIPYSYDAFNPGAENLYPRHYTLADQRRIDQARGAAGGTLEERTAAAIASARAQAEAEGRRFTSVDEARIRAQIKVGASAGADQTPEETARELGIRARPFGYSIAELQRLERGEKVFPHIFGTDKYGRDILVRVMYGTRVSMTIGVCAALVVLVIGALYGAVSGYFGGLVDTVMQRVVDVIYSIPEVLVILLLSTTISPHIKNFITANEGSGAAGFLRILGPNLIAMFLAFGILYWVGLSRIIRGQVLTIKGQEYVTAARALGASGGRIIRRHLLPNCVGQIVVTVCLQIPSAIFLESFMSYLGVGVTAPLTSLGSMCKEALEGYQTYTYRLLIPAVIISVMILAFNLFGDGLRDALDPRLKK